MLAIVNDNQPTFSLDELNQNFDLMRRASRHDPVPDHATRRANLLRLRDLLELHAKALVEAVREDFGWRSPDETRFADLGLVLSAIGDSIRHLKKWMRDEKVRMPMHHLPARGRIARVPLGVVGVIGPWNYPIQLTLVPVVNALAAGNRALLKPSELCPRTSAILKTIINESFPRDILRVHTGDAEFGAAFASLPFDHLFFTGSTAVGRKIAAAAAPNLTPVTLELGGKSPAIVTDAASLKRTADAIAWGKCLNAGQTCVAPDYVLVTEGQREQLIAEIDRSVRRRYGQWWQSGDYSSIISWRHYERLERLIGDAADRGTRGVLLGETPPTGAKPIAPRMMQPLILVDPDQAAAVMQEEIFGPVLPVITVKGRPRKPANPFRYFHSSPEVIRLVVMLYVRFPLSLRNVEDLLFERGIDICHETVRLWWNRFGPLFAADIRRQRVSRMRGFRHWRWHLDEVYVKINGEMHYLWRAVDHEGEVLESYVTKTRDKAAALRFMRKALKRHGQAEAIVTDGLKSYPAAMRELGNEARREVGRHANNRVENSHLPFRRRERTMQRFRQMKSLQKFASVHGSIYNHCNQERHLVDRQTYKLRRSAALAEWQNLMA